ncbi:telomere length regulation protein TEL2 homolog isoform X1 [Trichogramma pretiosum]|uniref:telomere length regulation protein TEL2 homolog isoform X1 n=1 Tax=Trichogramma pretiosum TaxID=7493 RepID=UPI0006C943FA|nr:telomere length regulation protein TEL2 homolog isoform X1 [Trichogramma pretiosum]
MMNMWKVRELMDKATNVVMNYTDTEAKVREATNDDAWGPTGGMMQELAQATFTYEQFPEVMSMLWKRMLQENKRNWRRTYKSLLLLNYLVRNGSERVVTSSREHIYDLRSLENYTYVDEFGKDQGINIRHKVRELIDFIQDDDKLREERKKAKKNKDKYIGMSSEAMGMRMGVGAADRWMDNPKWSGNSTTTGSRGSEGYTDWDKDRRKGSRGFEDGSNSDVEIDESDRRGMSNTRSVANALDRREYKDENAERLPKVSSVVSQQPNATSIVSPTRAPRVIKKVDLGAAANYGREQNFMQEPTKPPVATQKNRNDILNDIFDSQNDNNGAVVKGDDDDDFNPRAADNYVPLASAAPVIAQPTVGEFGDFASAFDATTTTATATTTTNKSTTDEFADFTSAFDNGLTISQHQTVQQPQMSLLNSSMPNIASSNALDNLMSATPMSAQINTGFGGNDLLNSQPQIVNNSNNNSTLSNTDLLSDLTDFNAPMVPSLGQNNLNNANLMNTNPLNALNTTAHFGIQAEKRMGEQLIEVLRAVGSSKSQSKLKKINEYILEYVKYLPGTLTPQKFVGEDSDYNLDDVLYSEVLKNLMNTFDDNWPVSNDQLDKIVKHLIVIDGADNRILNEIMLCHHEALKEAMNLNVIKCHALLMEELFKSDALYSAIVKSSRKIEEVNLDYHCNDEIWQSLFQEISSVPSRIANKMERDFLLTFRSDNFTDILSFHVLRAIHFLYEIDKAYKIEINTSVISKFLDKMLFSIRSNWTTLVDVLIEWCISDISMKSLIQNILQDISTQSIDTIAVLFLEHDKFNSSILSPLINSPDWRYIFMKKLPFMSYFSKDVIAKNLISCIYQSQTNEDKILLDLATELLEIWSDKSVMHHTIFEQHLYITKLIVLSMKSIKGSLRLPEKDRILQLIMSGVSTHLSAMDQDLRVVGMITGELITNLLMEDKCKDVPTLKFEYDGLKESASNIAEVLKTLFNEKERKNISIISQQSLLIGDLEFPNPANKKVYDLGVKCKILKEISGLETVTGETVDVCPNVSYTARSVVKKPTIHQESNDEELDSDDDLVPYDMSNDVKITEKHRPVYLRDLRDNLVNVDSRNQEQEADIFEETLKASENLILAQLPRDDQTFAVELLDIYLNLTQRSQVDDFEVLIFRSCVAIVMCHPKETANFLCREFHTEISRYSVQQRILILNILSESAQRLSKIPVHENTSEPKRRKVQPNKTVSLIINTDKSRKYETLYDDDFDDPAHDTNPGLDWKEIVEERLHNKTRHFAHKSKPPVTTINQFSKFVDSFFFPLIYGFCDRNSFVYTLPHNFRDFEDLLLTKYLETLATIMSAAQNCPSAPKVAKELLEICWMLKYHEQARVRFAVIKCIASVLVSVPEFIIKQELALNLEDLRSWLLDVTSVNMFRADTDADCQNLARQVLYLMNSLM